MVQCIRLCYSVLFGVLNFFHCTTVGRGILSNHIVATVINDLITRDFCELYDICERHLDVAMENHEDDSQTLISKLIARCGRNSKIPLIMGIDSLFAGIETTGKL